MKPALGLLLALAAVTAGCSTDQVARFVYYTFRVGNPAVEQSQPGSQVPSAPPMSYDRYQQERRGQSESR